MSDLMLLGVLRMPPDLWRDDPLDVMQRHSRYVEAAERIEADAAALRAAHERIETLNERLDNWERRWQDGKERRNE